MQQHNAHIIRFLNAGLLFFFIGYYSNSTMFYHSHEVNGKIYCHSHFFGFKNSKSIPVTSHTHTSGQFQLIDIFNAIHLIDELDFPEAATPIFSLQDLRQTDFPRIPHLNTPLTLRLRAPPAC